ncbi:hypothetical protein ACKUFS_08825 [Pseudomonas cannabina]|uniref:Uncharacterized protein n=1 Tax=Pseudomonas syringae pv. maculicola str. ES4326 TaxID=629265 RepID=A0A8T8C1D3_PSEYM|nr:MULTISPECIES: hypothetical protein [Pseudomonas syringae group]QHE97288.1 hypothetical protein PMA4326_012115 [Pseudomonas syringae pv. maculicola str. ES4326]QQN24469.1 hypothetical protein JGS08_13220 [Pseudomonas cannabina pv. alisalensis]UBY97952.1 hypothetical protein LCG56_01980 [Pseudomonas cannabina pv. alisalensis]
MIIKRWSSRGLVIVNGRKSSAAGNSTTLEHRIPAINDQIGNMLFSQAVFIHMNQRLAA